MNEGGGGEENEPAIYLPGRVIFVNDFSFY